MKPTGPELPNKRYFKIGEVSALVDVEPYVLRYWESEFSAIRPVRTSKRQRLYRKKDVEILLKIKHLLYEKGFTIAGARKELQQETPLLPSEVKRGCLEEIKTELLSIKDILS